MLLKEAIKEVSDRCENDSGCVTTAESLEDRLGTTMKFMKSSEAGFIIAISACIARYPALKDLVTNPYDVEGNLSVKLQKVRDHAIDLAREHATDELNQAHEDLPNGNKGLPSFCTGLLQVVLARSLPYATQKGKSARIPPVLQNC